MGNCVCCGGFCVIGEDAIAKNELEKCTYNSLKEWRPQFDRAWLLKVYDGDTIWVAAKPKNADGKIYRTKLRLAHFDAPEMKPKGGSEEEKKAETEAAIRSRDAIDAKLRGKLLYIEILNKKHDPYGRPICIVRIKEGIGGLITTNINDWMIAEGHGIPYEGGKKVQYRDWIKKQTNLQ
jgi:endonuclease YncB( thermonuclease family)